MVRHVAVALWLVAALPSVVLAQEAPEKPWAKGVAADNQERAEKLYADGNELFSRGEFTAALAQYQQAVELWDHPGIRFNMVVCLINMNRPLDAYGNLTSAMRFGAAPLGDDHWGQANTYLKLLRGQLAELTVSSDQSGVKITLDGKPVLSGPGTETRMLEPGRHQIVAEKPGYATQTRTLTLIAGRSSKEVVRVHKSVPASLEQRWPNWVPWSVTISGAVVAAVGVPLSLRARSNFDRFDDEVLAACPQPQGCEPGQLPGNIQDIEDRAKLQQRLAVAAFVTGGAAVVTGVVMLVLNRPRVVEPAIVGGGPGVSISTTW